MDTVDINRRFNHHPPTEITAGEHIEVRRRIRSLAFELNAILPEGREKALAMTALEECLMWSNAAVTRP